MEPPTEGWIQNAAPNKTTFLSSKFLSVLFISKSEFIQNLTAIPKKANKKYWKLKG